MKIHNVKILKKSEGHESSINSYIIGYFLSLVLTLIPYFLIKQQIFSKTSNWLIIISIAIIQMIIQVVFFLHLGRGPKSFYNVSFFIGTIGIVILVVFGSFFIINNLRGYMNSGEIIKKLAEDEAIYQINGKLTGACQYLNDNHQIIFNSQLQNPESIKAKLCDTLTFINQDDYKRQITFGNHPEHSTYAGLDLIDLKSHRSKTITLNQLGEYTAHDHLNPYMTVNFSVEDR